MLTFYDRPRGHSRRDFLRVGALGAGSLFTGASSASLLGMNAGGADGQVGKDGSLDLSLARWLERTHQQPALVRDKAVILLFLHGGPSQTETFDPKMTAPAGVRSVTGELKTSLQGVTFGGTFPKLAALADRMTVVRSFKSGNGNHDIKPVVDSSTAGANLGSIFSRLTGVNHSVTGIPRNAALFPRSVDGDSQKENLNFGDFASTGSLGAAYAPFVPGGDGDAQSSMELRMPQQHLEDRKSLLSQLDRMRSRLDRDSVIEGTSRFEQQAFDTILGGVAGAFDLNQEDPKTIASYDTAPLVRPDAISKRWNNYNNYVDNAKTLGKLLLLARRLCENGCGFVTVTTNFVWDMHSDVNNAGVEEGMQYMGRPLDHAVSAFIEDIEARGLSDKIMLVVTGEMGRTPRVNAKGGRDHWGGITPLLLYGGGLQMGQVIGQSNRDASAPNGEAYTNANLVSTILHTLVDLPTVRTLSGIPADVMRAITAADPIPGLL